jgi:hypothetical protein
LIAHAVRDFGGLDYQEKGAIVLHRGPYVVAAGIEASKMEPTVVPGHYLDLFDPNVPVRINPSVSAGSYHLLLQLGGIPKLPTLLTSGGKMTHVAVTKKVWTGNIEGAADIPEIVVLRSKERPATALFDGVSTDTWTYDSADGVFWLKCTGAAHPRRITLTFK